MNETVKTLSHSIDGNFYNVQLYSNVIDLLWQMRVEEKNVIELSLLPSNGTCVED